MEKKIEAGVFIPTVRSGWVHSTNAPHTPGSFKHALEVTRLAEYLGFDFVLSPQNWRGAQGPHRFWGDTVDSIAAAGALTQATDRINVWCTAHVSVHKPATIAKIVASLSEIGDGRIGLNVVTGGNYMQLYPLGFWDDMGHDERYDMAEDWVSVIRKYWSEEVVTHDGPYFKADGGILSPRPAKRPTLVNAGASPRGLKFAVDSCDIAFLMGGGDAKFVEQAKLAKQLAKDRNKPDFKVFGAMTIIPGETDEAAQELLEHLEVGADLVGLADLASGYQKNTKGFDKLSASSLAPLGGADYKAVMPGAIVGSYENLASKIAKQVNEADLDGILIIVPDYISHLNQLGTRTLPRLADFGIECSVGRTTAVPNSVVVE
ncbi:LLM class flavin-dependent oxidoreductase [Leisingera thetidis]|uniref:LLM class flavin-dependent oxidoreductase n=1 Tax=Leisingera thetidis TaxID=2930199 RepID=UPI0021F795EA|nr:LLM class flavin-dependent oxidoreductase [Leisingera thetidis]